MKAFVSSTCFAVALFAFTCGNCGWSANPEFRAAWIATVANIDWPSKPGLAADDQKAELIGLFDVAKELNLNAIILQVRPTCDAIYPSEFEPWSEFLTGEMGKDPGFDPLEFAVAEAHARELELHAWFNPYRALHPSVKGNISQQHVSIKHPEYVRRYGEYLWLDPGDQAAADHSCAVILDVVKRYDIDGVHLDDYFYPYPINDDAGEKVPFPDDPSWKKYIATTESPMKRDDWRRHSVDQLIERLYGEIKREKSWVKFGVSPFGIWRPGHPSQIKGFDQYAEIYADARKWLRAGWVDYFTPQLYWRVGPPAQSYSALLEWWHKENVHKRHLWPGNYTSRLLGEKPPWSSDEIVAQIWVTRAQSGASGNVHFSMKALAQNAGGIADALRIGPYHEPAPVPASSWLEDRPNSKESSRE